MLICTSHGWIDAAEPAAVFQKSKAAGQPILCLANGSDLPALQPFTGMSDRILAECATGGGIKFESHEGFDFIALEIPGQADSGGGKARVFLYFRPNLLLFGRGDPNVDPLLQDLRAQVDQSLSESGVLSLEKTLQQFFDRLTAKDMALLSLIEEEAAGVEERLLGSRSPELSPTILALRKRLLAYERYYSRLSLVSAAIEENENDLLTEKEVRYFHILTDRTNHLLDEIRHLQDYVSQIREAYQTQVDISQNQVMKLFTVITAVFLPLTLIVGWYGMNFAMPEYRWAYGYPVVILASVLVAVLSIVYFKRHRWF